MTLCIYIYELVEYKHNTPNILYGFTECIYSPFDVQNVIFIFYIEKKTKEFHVIFKGLFSMFSFTAPNIYRKVCDFTVQSVIFYIG